MAKINRSNRNTKTTTNNQADVNGADHGRQDEKYARRMALIMEKASRTRYCA